VKIAYITAGAAGMYCGTCLHDNTLAASLLARGEDVFLIPTYTPIRTDEQDVSIDRVFYGAINVYLEQKSALFRHTPWVVDRMLNGRSLLNWAAGHGAAVDGRELAALTLSVLRGEDGNQRKELERLVGWLRDDLRPDLVHLTNSMFLGLAGPIRQALGVPVICSVAGEDIFLDDMAEAERAEIVDVLRAKARDAAAFIAPSRYYVEHMAALLDVPVDRMHHVPLGLKLDGFRDAEVEVVERPFLIGYLARICPEKGLHLLVDAFRRLVETAGREQVRLGIAGYLGERDRAYFEGIMEQVRSWGLDELVDVRGEVDRQGKIEFLESLHVLSVPTPYREPKGLFVLEALASGVPVVQPRHGAFPEMIERTGGGILVDPDSAQALADGLQRMMEEPEHRKELGRNGRQAVRRDYNDQVMADATLEVYRRYVDGA
jgi:glycosyltransferase involved in cell wall biosynthesis